MYFQVLLLLLNIFLTSTSSSPVNDTYDRTIFICNRSFFMGNSKCCYSWECVSTSISNSTRVVFLTELFTLWDRVDFNTSFNDNSCCSRFEDGLSINSQYRSCSSSPLTSHIHFQYSNDGNNLPIIPGKKFQLPVTVVDDVNKSVSAVFHITVDSSLIGIDNPYVGSQNNSITLFGLPQSNVTMTITTKDWRSLSTTLSITVKECPPGYIRQEHANFWECVCSLNTINYYKGIASCNASSMQASIKRGFWIGYVDNETESGLLSGYCPNKRCRTNNAECTSLQLPDIPGREELQDKMCRSNTFGTLCGECSSGSSIWFHSNSLHCHGNRHCHIGWVLFIISELLPLTLIFLAVMILNTSFTSGIANGFIFFAQLVDSLDINVHENIYTTGHKLQIDRYFPTLIYKFLNLDFFALDDFAFCLWKKASTIDVLAVKYITTIYGLSLITVTVLVMKHFNCYQCCPFLRPRVIRSSVTHGLSTFLVMCYMQVTQVSMAIMTPAMLYSKAALPVHRVPFYQGNLQYLRGRHLLYAIPASIVLATLTLIPPVVLIMYPLLYRFLALVHLEESCFVKFLERTLSALRLKPLIDSFQGCFKDEFRFFAGLYFLYRLVIPLIGLFAPTIGTQYMLIEIALIIMLIAHATVQPYRQSWHNRIDSFLLALLSIINVMTLLNYSSSINVTSSRKSISMIVGVQSLLVSLPLLCIVGCLAFKLVRYIYCRYWRRREVNEADVELSTRTRSNRNMVEENECKYQPFEENSL